MSDHDFDLYAGERWAKNDGLTRHPFLTRVDNMWSEKKWRTGAALLAAIVLLAVLVGAIVYAFEESLGGLAYVLGQAIAAVAAVMLIAWMLGFRRQKKRQ